MAGGVAIERRVRYADENLLEKEDRVVLPVLVVGRESPRQLREVEAEDVIVGGGLRKAVEGRAIAAYARDKGNAR